MSILTNNYTLRRPVEHRVTVMETAEDQHYYGRTYDCYPNDDGTITVSRGLGHDEERVPFMGMYLVEELTFEGEPNGMFEMLTPEEFNERLQEVGDPGLEYGYRAVGGANIFFHPLNASIGEARRGLSSLQEMHPLGKFEVVSRPAGSDDEWTVVGR
jgi:hypothetical protein